MRIILSILLNAVAVYFTARILPGAEVDGFLTALIAGLVLAVVNLIVKPIITILTLPITIITLGLFLLVINALMVLLVDWIVPGFEVDGIFWALIFSLVMWLLNLIFEGLNLK